nr:ABC transporter substrate-binding protein [Lentibacillus sediminis]
MKSLMTKFIMFIALTLLLAACGESDASSTSGEDTGDQDVLTMATSADFPPFESRDPEGNFEGFDIDLANRIAEELGYELEIEDMSFDGLIGALQSNRVDMVMAGMSATEERKQNVDFSESYHRSGEMFITVGEPLENLESLEGKTVGVQLGTIQEEGADKLSEEYGFDVHKVDNSGLLIQEINSDRIDVAYMDKQVALGYLEEHDTLAGFDDPTTVSPGMAVAFPKGSELVEDVNAVLAELEESGELQELKDKWELDAE